MERKIYNDLYTIQALVNENHRNSIVCLESATIFQFSQINTKRNSKYGHEISISENAIYIHIELHFKFHLRTQKEKIFWFHYLMMQ